ncbi:MAG TPA: hypothetical protein DCX89_08590 [Saprospirales bacterium]|nr:hypothetical protein [Saprospirales bacterium]HAY71935.1 hypothetical protein [Saprospirales bacterium]HRQ29070.1 DUF2007 domain-containing protein [Saprospiraceae bacterium]
MKILTIKQFSDEAKAMMYKHRLDEEGIHCIISNAIVSTLFPLGAGAFSLQVLEDDFDAALAIINELDQLYTED